MPDLVTKTKSMSSKIFENVKLELNKREVTNRNDNVYRYTGKALQQKTYGEWGHNGNWEYRKGASFIIRGNNIKLLSGRKGVQVQKGFSYLSELTQRGHF